MRQGTRMTTLLVLLAFGAGAAFGGPDTWTLLGPWGGRCGTMSMDQTNPNVLWVSHNAPMKTTNAGLSWSPSNNGIPWWSGKPQCCGITVAPSDHNSVYAHG